MVSLFFAFSRIQAENNAPRGPTIDDLVAVHIKPLAFYE